MFIVLTIEIRIAKNVSTGCVSDPSTAFVTGILEPLHNLRRLGRLPNSAQTCLIVIDGLGEAEAHRPDHGNTIASFLSKHLDRFPDWLKVVCTVRTSLQEVVARLPFQRIGLDKTDVDERLNKDMTDYILARIGRSQAIQENIRPTSVKAAEGSPEARITQFLVQVICIKLVIYPAFLTRRFHPGCSRLLPLRQDGPRSD